MRTTLRLLAALLVLTWWVVPGSPHDLFSEQPKGMWSQVLRRQPSPLNLMSTYPTDPLLN